MSASQAVLEALRSRVAALERPCARGITILPFGVPEIDVRLPGGGLSRSALHEVSGGGEAGLAASSLFVAGLFARMAGAVLWCATGDDVFAPGLACAGLHPDRVFHARAPDEKTVLLLMEEALRHPGLGGVLGELSRLPMTASRRLVLAAERSGVMAVALRRRREGRPEDTAPNAAATRWRITPVASQPLPCPGIGRARWRVELVRCRGGSPGEWIMEACDAQGAVSLPAGLADGSAAPERRVA